jgi:hypothetical protein
VLAILVGFDSSNVPAAPREPACFPQCRSGYLCHEGQCLSACNPPCDAGQACTAAGECAAVAPVVVAPSVESQGASSAPAAADPGWARGAFYLGVASVALDVGLTAAVIATNPHQPGRSRTIGSWAIVAFGVTAPLTALGAASARGNPAVVGRPRIRLASWITYGLALADSAYLLSQSRIAVIDNRYVVGAGLLGTLSTVGFAMDAYASATSAEALRARTSMGLAIAPNGAVVPTWGWAGVF